jgi:nicotinate-nucleotide adenylyltransferase
MTRKIGILGGTFDPIHKGHTHIARCAQAQLNLDLVLVQPNKTPYYKKSPTASEYDRLKMVELATCKDNFLLASDFEIKLNSYSCTYDTLALMKQSYPKDTLVLIIGMDSFLYLDKWINGLNILDIANIAVMTRPQYSINMELISSSLRHMYNNNISTNNLITKASGQLFMVDCPPFDISATELRNFFKLKNYDKLHQFIDQDVLKYIKEQNLYIEI